MNNEQRMIETSEIEFVNSEWVQNICRTQVSPLAIKIWKIKEIKLNN